MILVTKQLVVMREALYNRAMAKARKAKKETRKTLVKMVEPLVRGKLRASYVRYLPEKRQHRMLAWGMATGALIIIIAQLLYPPGYGLPLAGIPGHPLALATHEAMAKAIVDQFDVSKLKLTLGSGKSVEYPLKSAGAEPNTEEMIKRLSDYPLWQRFVPGSILWQSARLVEADIYYSQEPFQQFVDARCKDLSFPPQNARLAIEKSRIVATEAVAGSTMDCSELLSIISRTTMLLGKTTNLTVPTQLVQPVRTSKDLAKVQAKAEVALNHTVTITADNRQFSPSKSEQASCITISKSKKGDVNLTNDKEKIKTYLKGINKKVGKSAGQTNITIVDGRETGRRVGSIGRTINGDALTKHLATVLLVPPPTVTIAAQFVDLQPSVIFNSRYTATRAGLQAFIDDIARTRNMRISIIQLDGGRWTAQARATESIPSASTYKLFVALVLFDRINKGEIHWSDPMLDTTVAGCFERMTVASTNPCAEKWIAMFGRQYINNFIYARGFSKGTSFTTGSANQTTAGDLTKFMIGLDNGTLVSGANRARLLDSLGRHPYRYGIPTGSVGVVHDKVGFLWDYVHDAAIVQHPRGKYIMTIMTKGQSYSAIATATREIERIMYP
jgi:hypothetical protein